MGAASGTLADPITFRMSTWCDLQRWLLSAECQKHLTLPSRTHANSSFPDAADRQVITERASPGSLGTVLPHLSLLIAGEHPAAQAAMASAFCGAPCSAVSHGIGVLCPGFTRCWDVEFHNAASTPGLKGTAQQAEVRDLLSSLQQNCCNPAQDSRHWGSVTLSSSLCYSIHQGAAGHWSV